MNTLAYCENGACRVELFHTKDKDGNEDKNCPGCGLFGRTKDEPKYDPTEAQDGGRLG